MQRIKTLRWFTEMISVSYHLGFYILKKLSVFFVGEILHPGDPKKKKEACVIHTKACLFLGQGGAGQGRAGLAQSHQIKRILFKLPKFRQ
jgi:hypothetical protein